MRRLLFVFLMSVMGIANAQTNTLVLDFKDDVTPQQIQEFESKYNVSTHLNSIYSDAEELRVTENLSPERQASLLKEMADDPLLERAEETHIYTIPEIDNSTEQIESFYDISSFPNDPQYKFQWHMNAIRMPEAWKLATGKNVVVAVIDTGVAYENYTDTKRNIKFQQAEDLKDTCMVPGYDFVNDSTHANDDHAHGTHVAGTIAQSTHNGVGVTGIAYQSCIMPIKVLSAQGGGTVADIADGIRFAADNGAKVINMSLGGPFPSGVMKDACDYARSKGVVIVAAAGNDGRGRIGYPAAYEGVIAVSSTDLSNGLAFYSNWGKEIGIAAPGGDTRKDENKDGVPDGVVQNTIKTMDPSKQGYFPFMGTSMASPHVAGVVALIFSAGVKDPQKVKDVLYNSANRKIAEEHGAPKGEKWDEKYGHGMLDAAEAVKQAKKMAGVETEDRTLVAQLDTISSFSISFLNIGLSSVFLAVGLALLLLAGFVLERNNQLTPTFNGNKTSYIAGASVVSVILASFFASAGGLFSTLVMHSAVIPILLVGFLNQSAYKNWVTGGVFVYLGIQLGLALIFLVNLSILSACWYGANAMVCAFLGYNNLKK